MNSRSLFLGGVLRPGSGLALLRRLDPGLTHLPLGSTQALLPL